MNYLLNDLDGETALILVDILHSIAEEILSRNDGAIRMHYAEIDEMHRRPKCQQEQLLLPIIVPFSNLPF